MKTKTVNNEKAMIGKAVPKSGTKPGKSNKKVSAGPTPKVMKKGGSMGKKGC